MCEGAWKLDCLQHKKDLHTQEARIFVQIIDEVAVEVQKVFHGI